jgi:hypothetical protein
MVEGEGRDVRFTEGCEKIRIGRIGDLMGALSSEKNVVVPTTI